MKRKFQSFDKVITKHRKCGVVVSYDKGKYKIRCFVNDMNAVFHLYMKASVLKKVTIEDCESCHNRFKCLTDSLDWGKDLSHVIVIDEILHDLNKYKHKAERYASLYGKDKYKDVTNM